VTFNSLQFMLVFLPVCYAGFLLAHRGLGWRGAYAYLAVASLVFYAQFSVTLAAVLSASITANFLFGRVILALRERGGARGATAVAVLLNLVALGYFKYANFFIDIANSATGGGISQLDILVPIGVSFFTFTQIGYLIEASSGQAERVSFAKYALFAGFFPCVTAGPLLLQRDIFAQMGDRTDSAFSSTRLAIGLTLFGIGLFKKVILADSFAPHADAVFDGAAAGAALTMAEAWTGALSYTLQLYFDFSGYSDMAIGIATLFGFKLPLNFNSPFKAASISDFWNRWHMTMTRFFTTYLYTPMAYRRARQAALKRHGRFRRWLSAGALPVFYTFLVAGIWHGAGWTFVVFGLIHGLALAVNHGWREWRLPSPGPRLGWLMTMSVVVTGLVMFRAPDVGTAGTILAGMWRIDALLAAPQTIAAVALDVPYALALIGIGAALVLLTPNSQEILRNHWISSDAMPDRMAAAPRWLCWSPSAGWAAAAAAALVIAATSIGDGGAFLYYDF
jgi:alginate O-acetyltransferase complex protein AlgI